MSKMDFLPMPRDAMFDPDLSLNDLRVLAAIAHHDRKGANGRGCFATTSTLAQMAGCDTRTVKRAVARLRAIGYIRTEPSKEDGRRQVSRVVYPSEHCENGDTGVTDLAGNRGQVHPQSGTSADTLPKRNQRVIAYKQNNKHMLLNNEADAENLRHSSRNDANSLSIDAKIALIDRHKKTVSVDDLFRAVTFLQETIEQLGDDPNDRICGWAQRVLEDVHEELYRCGAA